MATRTLSTDPGRGRACTPGELTPLQHKVLLVALLHREHGSAAASGAHPVAPPVDACMFELFAATYGWEPRTWDGLDGKHFDRKTIGERTYQSARSAMARAVGGLEGRGLVVQVTRCPHLGRRVSGVRLTIKGVKEALARWCSRSPTRIHSPG